MKLYYNPQSRAAIAKWMLDECGAEYDIVPIDFQKREHKSPEFLKINPPASCPRWWMGTRGFLKVRRSASILATSFRKQSLLRRSARRNAAAIYP